MPTTSPTAFHAAQPMTIEPIQTRRGADGSPSPIKITPTDVSQFVRYEMCERFLRFQLHSRNVAYDFMRDFGLRQQTLSPILSGSGRDFEKRLEDTLSQRSADAQSLEVMRDFAARADSGDRRRKPDNDEVIQAARDLQPGQTAWLLQPRLVVPLHGWELRGDVDVLRLRRDASGRLQVLVADMKASPHPKVDQKLQVAFYHEMLAEMLAQARIEHEPIECGVLYRGPLDPGAVTDIEARRILAAHQDAAAREFGDLLPAEDSQDGVARAYFDAMDDREAFLLSARQMVFDAGSYAAQAAGKPFSEVNWHLSHKCDGCPFSEWCLQSANQSDDLSLLPYITPEMKVALHRADVRTVAEMSRLKRLKDDGELQAHRALEAANARGEMEHELEPSASAGEEEDSAVELGAWNELETQAEHREAVRDLTRTRGVGSRLDEMILRSHALIKRREGASSLLRFRRRLSRKGYSTLPFSSPEVNPNLVTLYIDAQYDFLNDRLCGLGTLVVAHQDGVEKDSRAIVHLSDAPPATEDIERDLVHRWINDTLRAVVEMAAPTPEGEMKAPLHLVFFDAREQKELLDALGRHFGTIRQATPLYDFIQQIDPFDSGIASFLDQEMRERRNYPLTCPSLYEVASYLGFSWREPLDFRALFSARLFDGGGYLELEDDSKQWRQRRARYGSAIPLEYAHAAWGILPDPAKRGDAWSAFRDLDSIDRGTWLAFAKKRLEAIRHVARDFEGNRWATTKKMFSLPDLSQPRAHAPSRADALEEFLMIERHAELGSWKAARHAPPERRALAGDSLICRYVEDAQAPEVREQNRRNPALDAAREAARNAWKEANPDKRWSSGGLEAPNYDLTFKLRLEVRHEGVRPSDIIALSGLSAGQRVILAEHTSVDSRLPPEQQKHRQTTARQLLHGMRADLQKIEPDEDGKYLWLHIAVKNRSGDGLGAAKEGDEEAREYKLKRGGFVFGGWGFALAPGQLVTIEPEINNEVSLSALKTLDGLRRFNAPNTLLDRLGDPQMHALSQSIESQQQQQENFMRGLQVLAQTDKSLAMEESKQDFIGASGARPFLLVQGPPGTGKTYASSWALLARLQAATREGRELRILVSCKTHSAIDVLLRGLQKSMQRLKAARQNQPEVFARYFDARLFDIPLLRYNPKSPEAWMDDPSNAGLEMVLDKDRKRDFERRDELDKRALHKRLPAHACCVVGATPNACFKMCSHAVPSSKTGDDKKRALFDADWFGLLVVDEASQMSLPEAVMSSIALRPDAPIIIVGDPRQMPPIVSHDWRNETRRTFASFKAFASLYDVVSALDAEQVAEQVLAGVTRGSQEQEKPDVHPVDRISFEESFRLHRDMAEFLRREIYQKDGIAYHSKLTKTLEPPRITSDDPLVRAALNPLHPLVVIVHEEEGSVLSNEFEHKLAAPILRALSGQDGHALDARDGLGVVVPHRAQRALMRGPDWNVDTVERFQGDEREAMLFCATESERGHLLRAGGFLFDPRRLNVALSRAKKKMILVASRQVFSGFFADEETFANAMLWKNLLRHTCNVPLHRGEMGGIGYEVWGNDPDWQ